MIYIPFLKDKEKLNQYYSLFRVNITTYKDNLLSKNQKLTDSQIKYLEGREKELELIQEKIENFKN